MKRYVWGVMAVVLLVAVIAGLVGGSFAAGVSVDVAQVQRGAIQQYVDEQGKTRLPQTYLITMPYPGRIAPITHSEGSHVGKGDLVAQVVPEDAALAVRAAQAAANRLDASIAENLDTELEQLIRKQALQYVASMEQAELAAAKQVEAGLAKKQYADANRRRLEALYQRGAATEDELDRAKLQQVEDTVAWVRDQLTHSTLIALKAAMEYLPATVERYIEERQLADAVLQQQRAEAAVRLEQAKLQQRRGALISPVDGMVLHRFVTDERFLPAGEPLLEIGRLEDLEIEADILSADVVGVQPGNRVLIYGPAVGRHPTEDRSYALGTVHKVFPAAFTKISSLGVEEQRVKVIVHLDANDSRWLREDRSWGVGYRVRVRIITDEKSNVLLVPRSALLRDSEGKWLVYAVSEGRVAPRHVQLGLINDTAAEVVEGLDENELVVCNPETELSPGARVVVERTLATPADGSATSELWSRD